MDLQSKGLVESDPEYATIYGESVRDPPKLLECIERQVVIRSTAASSSVRVLGALSNLYGLHQLKDEWLSQYYKRFNGAVEEIRYSDKDKVPKADELAILFCKSINSSQFHEQVAIWNRDNHSGKPSWPNYHNIAFNFLMQTYPEVKPITSVKGKHDAMKPTADVAFPATVGSAKLDKVPYTKECSHCHKKGHDINNCWTLYPIYI